MIKLRRCVKLLLLMIFFFLFALKAKAIKLVPLENSWFSYVALVSVA
jgi:hypothetical protein